MNCKGVSQKLGSYLDGELAGFEMQEMRSHLYDCAACAEQVESYRSLKSALSNLPCFEPPCDLEDRLMRSVRMEAAPISKRSAGFVWGSAIVAAASAGFVFVWLMGSPAPGANPSDIASQSRGLPSELSKDQAYIHGMDSLSGQTMVVPASYGGSSNGR